tara:strand:+ start:514 stop:1326 length:813 start_codon:yes stop_codon:yes gene_type:complete
MPCKYGNRPRKVKKQVTKNLSYVMQFASSEKISGLGWTKRKHNARKCYFGFPSSKCGDLKQFHKDGVIDNNTKLICVENDPGRIKGMKNNLSRLGYKRTDYIIIQKDLCDISWYDINNCCDALGVEGVDLFYLDTCNCLIDCFQQWLEDVLGQSMTDDAIVAINTLGARATRDLEKYYMHYESDKQEIREYWNGPIGLNLTLPKNRWLIPSVHCVTSKIGEGLRLIHAACYKDTQPMNLVVVENFGNRSYSSDSVWAFLTDQNQNLGYAS